MTKKDYQKISMSIWRSGFAEDKNKIRQKAKEDIRRLIVSDLIGEFKGMKNFNEKEFLEGCNIS